MNTFQFLWTLSALLCGLVVVSQQVALIILAPGFEEIELATLYRFLTRAGVELRLVSLPGPHYFPVIGAHQIPVYAHEPFPRPEDTVWSVVILPGGAAASEALAQPIEVGNLLKIYEDRRRVIAAGITSAKVLQPYRIYETLKVAASPSVRESITQHWYVELPVVLDQSLVTSRSVVDSAEFALAIVQRVVSKSMSEQLRKEWYDGVDVDQ
ncbi:hypothetical protein FGIG_12465 [Fasciola gigantica]|uniref:DJ-1/PfpI domain-containing protein n=1 Tax=Fasciola gigantica TaxID=46835 RepID=A0A504Y6R4_FASGI|nr:hypothetical protein FGIG_12465 [Fasciola gigantica]